MPLPLTYSTYTSPGTRAVNEDSFAVRLTDMAGLFVLCDGLGGHGMGDTASALAAEIMARCFEEAEKAGLKDPRAFLRESTLAAQRALLEKQMQLKASRKMKTTIVSLLCDERKAYAAHVGDSRLYVFHRNKVLKRTTDHSVPQMMALSGLIRESEIRSHPERSSLLRVLGTEWEQEQTECEKPLPMRKCQAFLLCSDGFWELIEERDMERYLAEAGSVQEWLDMMVRHVNTVGEGRDMDNNTAVAVWT